MAGLFSALNAGRTSLETNQKSIEIVGNNISNVNTEGYSRQESVLTPYPAMNMGGFFIGEGVRITDIQRDHDIFVENQLTEKSVDFGYQSAQSRPLSELERIIPITDNNLSTDIDNFFDSWQELSASPSDLVLRDVVIQRGEELATTFQNTINELNSVQSNINDTLVSMTDEINSALTEIAALNQRIFNIEVTGQSANTAKDRRELLAKDLAQKLGAQSFYDSKGMLALQLPGGLPLVQATSAMEVEAVSSGSDVKMVLHAGGVTKDISGNNLGGELAGHLYIRDEFIAGIKDDIDRLAYEVGTQVNTQHNAGVDLDSNMGGDFFVDPTNTSPTAANLWTDAARNFAVAVTDAAQLAAAEAPAGAPPLPAGHTVAPGDNRNVLLIANLDESYLIDGIDNFNSYYGKVVATVGLEANQNELSLQGAEDAVVQLENLRDGLAGVSLEEEMINLIQYQRGFESSAKFLTTVDDLMDTLIQLKR